MAKLYIDRLEPFHKGQDRTYGIDVYDIDTEKRFARVVPTPGGAGAKWTIYFYHKPPVENLLLHDALVIIHKEAEFADDDRYRNRD